MKWKLSLFEIMRGFVNNRLGLFLFLFSLTVFVFGKQVSFLNGGFKYIIFNDSTVRITDAGFESPVPIIEDSTLVIPSSVTHNEKLYRVVSICDGAFATRPEIKHVVINDGVETISGYAFYRCPNLKSVFIPSSVSWIGSVDHEGFVGCHRLCSIKIDEKNEYFDSRENCNAVIRKEDNTLILGCIGTTIPSSVTTIGAGSFGHRLGLDSIVVPEGVKTLEPFAFNDCYDLKKISLPNSLEKIGGYVFNNCLSLESITIPRLVSCIEPGVFSGCYNLKKITVDHRNPYFDSRKECNAIIDSAQDTIVAGCGRSVLFEGIKGIGSLSFANTSLQSVRIPKSVEKIAVQAFTGCNYCNSISVHPENPVYHSKEGCNAIIETSTRKLLQGCPVTSIPDDVEEIGDYAFAGLSLPCYLVIPEGVKIIGTRSFSNCKGLEQVQMPASLTLIKEFAFTTCNDLTDVDLTKSTTQIEAFAFYKCQSLRVVTFSSHPGIIDPEAFKGCLCEERMNLRFNGIDN